MSLPGTAAVLALAAAATAAHLTAASASAEPIPLAERPHSRVVTLDHGDVRVERLTMSVAQRGQHLHAKVTLGVSNDSTHEVRRELRVGRCTGGPAPSPVCPTGTSVPVRLGRGESRRFFARAALPLPPARPDAVQAALVPSGASQPYGYRADGFLILAGTAWRGPGEGRAYGVRFGAADGARRLVFDIPLTAPDWAYVDVRWDGSAAPAGVPTTLSHCAGEICTSAPLAPERRRSRPGQFGHRLGVDRAPAEDALGLAVGLPGEAPLVEATLPWPAMPA